jgi:hypothetical protein
MSLFSLYGTLYHYREANEVVVLDDIDSVMEDVKGVNILKAAMDTKAIRTISWESTSSLLSSAGIPTSFEYRGRIILISNIKSRSGKSKIGAHLQALKDRAFAVTVADSSIDSQFRQVCYMVLKQGLLDGFGLSEEQQHEALGYLWDNISHFERISLRTAIKLGQLISQDPMNWRFMAGSGVLDNAD